MPLFTLHFHNRETPDSSAEPTSKILDNTQFRCDFHLQEWTSLRAEITSQIDHTRKLELATVAGLGAFYGWFFVTKAEHSNLTNFLQRLTSSCTHAYGTSVNPCLFFLDAKFAP